MNEWFFNPQVLFYNHKGSQINLVWFQRGYITLANLKMTMSGFRNSLCHRKQTWLSKEQQLLLLESMEKTSVSRKMWAMCLCPAQLPSPSEEWPVLWNPRSEEFARRGLSALRHGNVELATSPGRELKFRQAYRPSGYSLCNCCPVGEETQRIPIPFRCGLHRSKKALRSSIIQKGNRVECHS